MLRRSRTRFLTLIDFSTHVCIITTERTLPKCCVGENSIVVSPKHSHLVCARPFHQCLHHFPPPNPSTKSFYRCHHYLPLPTPSELLHQRLHQIPPTNPSTNTSCFSTTQSFCMMFRCSLPSRGSCSSVARGAGRHKASRLTANPDPDNHPRRSTGTWWVCMRVCVCVCCAFVCWCVLSIVRMLVTVPSPNGPTPLPIRATLQVVNQQFNGRSSTGILSCALPLDCDTVRISSRACCPLLLCPHRLALHSRHLGE